MRANPWIYAVGAPLLTYLFILGCRRILTYALGKYSRKTTTQWDDFLVVALKHTTHVFMLALSVFIALKLIPHERRYNTYINRAFFVVSMLQVGVWLNLFVNSAIISFFNRKTRKNPAAATSISLIQFLVKLLLLSVVLLFTLHNLGINITTILAGFGVGGIAVALALQKVVGDLLSSLSIVSDKPFVVGDFIVMDQYMGEVEKIGLRTTRLRSLSGEQIIISNSDILGTRIRNFKRMKERRVIFSLGLPLYSEPKDIKKAIRLISEAVHSTERTRFERCHLKAINRDSLEVETVYWVLSDDFDTHMDLQQNILLNLISSFKENGLSFVYPTSEMNLGPREFFHRFEPKDLEKENSSNERSIS